MTRPTSSAPSVSQQLTHSSGSFELVLSGVMLGLVGLWIDNRIGSTPWLTVLFTVLGFGGACISMYYRYKNDIARQTQMREASQ